MKTIWKGIDWQRKPSVYAIDDENGGNKYHQLAIVQAEIDPLGKHHSAFCASALRDATPVIATLD